jgi:hypothetical protein
LIIKRVNSSFMWPGLADIFRRNRNTADKTEDAFARGTGSIGESCSDRRFAGTRNAGDEDAGSPMEAPACQHVVEIRNPGRNPIFGNFVIQTKRGYRQDTEAFLIDAKRIFIYSVRRATILDDAEDGIVDGDHVNAKE